MEAHIKKNQTEQEDYFIFEKSKYKILNSEKTSSRGRQVTLSGEKFSQVKPVCAYSIDEVSSYMLSKAHPKSSPKFGFVNLNQRQSLVASWLIFDTLTDKGFQYDTQLVGTIFYIL